MSTINEVHSQHIELISEIEFMKTEIKFLMNVLRNAYCASIADSNVKTLDTYWKAFELISKQLDTIHSKVKTEEKVLTGMVKEDLLSIDKNIVSQQNSSEDSGKGLYKKLNKEIKVYKESFYDYMIDCKECMIKKH